MAATQIFVNLPVKNLARSVEFFTKLGYKFDPQFTDENATCMIVSDNIYVMLLFEKFFQTFTKKPICDATKNTEVLLCLSCESRAEVDEQVRKAVAAGGTSPREPQDHGFMYGHGFEDLDGHIWELLYWELIDMQPGADKASPKE
ncbi:MAG: extradiol dioxygenase [Burkholderiales bacterium RIFCSPHIGHO2_12_FULL_61_11]|nr:MAG: extradiol dioxygenase [Burkholderiales bacterium RIFCSPHIGHO2_12_FULL_61_11]